MKVDFSQLFRAGIIAPWYLKQSQIPLYEMLLKERRVVTNCHRRFGKDTTTMCYVLERCHQESIIVRYGAPTMSQAYEILGVVFDHIYEKSPDMKPKMGRGGFIFPSGSRISIFGGKDSNELDKARGSEAHIIVLSEFGFFQHKPQYLLDSVLSPQLMTTNGQMIILSTPPRDLLHPYIDEVRSAQAKGRLFLQPITASIAAGDVSQEQHERIIEDCKGITTDSYRREYACELIADTSVLVIPEAQDESRYVGAQDRPPFFDFETCCDLGFRDYFAQLFGYLDLVAGRLVIEDELSLKYKSTREITEECIAKEGTLGVKPWRRLGDSNDPQQLFDMAKDHGYPIQPITKRSKQSGQGFLDSILNQLRVGIGQGKILIHPRCKNTIAQLHYGIWKENRTDFERSDRLGHLDNLMALAYMYDNIMWKKNPYPILGNAKTSTHFISSELLDSANSRGKEALKKMMKPPRLRTKP